MKRMYRIIGLFTHQRKFVPEIVPLWLKNLEKIGINTFIREGLCAGGLYEGGRAYAWSNTSVKEKVGLSEWGPIRGGILYTD